MLPSLFLFLLFEDGVHFCLRHVVHACKDGLEFVGVWNEGWGTCGSVGVGLTLAGGFEFFIGGLPHDVKILYRSYDCLSFLYTELRLEIVRKNVDLDIKLIKAMEKPGDRVWWAIFISISFIFIGLHA